MTTSNFAYARQDFLASIVVFLVALPLCMGVAVAAGLPPASGILSGIIGGLIVGSFAGCPLQVSGPQATLGLIVWDIVQEHGLAALGPVVVMTGLLQILAGVLKSGQWFRAVSPAVINGMLSGIGVLIFASQFHVMVDDMPKGSGLNNLLLIPKASIDCVSQALFSHGSNNHIAGIIGLVTIFALILWQSQPYKRLKVIPGSLVAVVVATILAQYFHLPIRYVELPDNLFSSLQFVNGSIFKYMSNHIFWLEALALAFVASAETLLTATAIDRMQSGKRTNYDRELASQGIGNFLCGLLGVLPLNGVIVRSSANVQAGGKTRMSTMLHGLWLLVFVSFFPSVLRMIPLASLAALLVYTGFKLINIQVIRSLYPYGKAQVGIYIATVITIVSSGLLNGVLTGFVLSVLHLLYVFSHLEIKLEREPANQEATLFLKGSATFLSLPKLASVLEEIEPNWQLHVHLEDLDYIDHACLDLLMNWESQHNNTGGSLIIDWKTLGAKFHERRSRNASEVSKVETQKAPELVS